MPKKCPPGAPSRSPSPQTAAGRRPRAFDGLGRALRWLREQRLLKQYQAAEAAGITKAMLSAYETGKQKPTLDTLERLLSGLGVGLSDLSEILAMMRPSLHSPLPVPGRDHRAQNDWAQHDWVQRESVRPMPRSIVSQNVGMNLHRIFGEDLDHEEEAALQAMLSSYVGWLKILRNRGLEPSLDTRS